MDLENFRAWSLERVGSTTTSNREALLRALDGAGHALDEKTIPQLRALLSKLAYSREDERNQRPDRSGRDVELSLYSTLANQRVALRQYIAFRESHETGASASSARNPNWTRDELILALDVYRDFPTVDKHHAAVVDLSDALNRLWAARSFSCSSTFRNPAGVAMKLSNFQRFDPKFTSTGRKGLTHGARADKEIWDAFADNRDRLRELARAIRATLDLGPELLGSMEFISAGELAEEPEAAEGAILTGLHRYRERDKKIANKRKQEALDLHGRLTCEACNFDFREAYGERGRDFIEVHHVRPLWTLEPNTKTKTSDLALLCANCHRMVHAKRDWLTMDQLRELLETSGAHSPPRTARR